jgi:hypothetical protein
MFDGMAPQVDLSGKHAVTKARAPATLSGHTPLKRTGRKVPGTRSAGRFPASCWRWPEAW